jgi:hypothetical protein
LSCRKGLEIDDSEGVPVRYNVLPWSDPVPLSGLDFTSLKESLGCPGVYVFTEYDGPLTPNPKLPPESDPTYLAVVERLRRTRVVLYVGKASNLYTRLPGYRFKPYLEIKRRKGATPRHKAPRHRGRALLHAQQFYSEFPLYLRWAADANPAVTEHTLINELNPVLNAYGFDVE